jgi:hypothetical protein
MWHKAKQIFSKFPTAAFRELWKLLNWKHKIMELIPLLNCEQAKTKPVSIF